MDIAILPRDIRSMAEQLIDNPNYYIPAIIPKNNEPLSQEDRERVIEELNLYLQLDDAEKVPDAIRRARIIVPKTSSFIGASKKRKKKRKTKRRVNIPKSLETV